MNLKYKLRYLGMGIVVTSLIFIISYQDKSNAITDEEVIIRAEKIGMVMESSSIENADDLDETKTEESESILEASSQEERSSIIAEESLEESSSLTDEENLEERSSITAEERLEERSSITEPVKTNVVEIEISPGDDSGSVSKKLEKGGIVESAKIYDNYLCYNGYDKKILVGKYEIIPGTSEREIANIITSRK